MKLINLKEMPELFRGCVAPGVRMTASMQELFNTSPKHLLRARCQSGVRIHFVTDAEVMKIGFRFGGTARKIFTADVEFSGRMLTLDGEGIHTVALPGNETEVVIHLPHLVEIEDIHFEISRDAVIRSVPAAEKRIIFCGDSIFQGMTSTTPTRALAPQVAAALGMDFVNISVGGARLDPAHVAMCAQLPGDVMIVGLGVNDALKAVELELFRDNAAKSMANFATFPGKKFLVMPIPKVASAELDLEVYREVIRSCAGEYPQIKVIDGYDLFPPREELYADGLHPNDAGFKIYAEGLSRGLAAEL